MKHKRFTHKIAQLFWNDKRKWVTIALTIFTLCIIFLGYIQLNNKFIERLDLTNSNEKINQLVLVESPLSGLLVSEADASRSVTAVMIENSPEARPQSGLKDAGVVYEAVAEGGITRFMALYQDTQPKKLGPVRSLRPYFLDWALGYDASIAHVGGSAEALSLVKTLGAKDLDQFFAGGSYYRSTDRYAPHNVYTSIQALDELNISRGFTKSTYTSWSRKADEPATSPDTNKIIVPFSTSPYKVTYTYDSTRNEYKRDQAGNPHLDKESQEQIKPKAVVVMSMPTSYKPTGHAVMQTIGSGVAHIFQDGIHVEGTWKKSGRTNTVKFFDKDQHEIKLNAGQVWISVLPADKSVSFE